MCLSLHLIQEISESAVSRTALQGAPVFILVTRIKKCRSQPLATGCPNHGQQCSTCAPSPVTVSRRHIELFRIAGSAGSEVLRLLGGGQELLLRSACRLQMRCVSPACFSSTWPGAPEGVMVSLWNFEHWHGRYKSQDAKGGVRVTDDVDRDFYRWDAKVN